MEGGVVLLLRTVMAMTAVLLCLSPMAARSDVVGFSQVDEIENVATHVAVIPVDGWNGSTNATAFRFRCSPSGTIGFGWFRGGRYSGSYWTSGIIYKIDDQPVEEFTVMNDAHDYKIMIKNIMTGKRMVAKTEYSESTEIYDLTGSSRAFLPFFDQCIN
jgi:hypothetical protein